MLSRIVSCDCVGKYFYQTCLSMNLSMNLSMRVGQVLKHDTQKSMLDLNLYVLPQDH